MIFLGIFISFLGFVLVILSGRKKGMDDIYSYDTVRDDSYGTNMDPDPIQQNRQGFHSGGLVMIGPIPVVIGSDISITRVLLFIGLLLSLLWIILVF